MGKQTLKEVSEKALERRARVLTYITQDPPVPFRTIMLMEGMHDRACRKLIKSLEEEHGIDYYNSVSRPDRDELSFGLTIATSRLRASLGDRLYYVTQRAESRDAAAPAVGLNRRQQVRAETKPFNHDWTLSQIERLARAMGKEPLELLSECMKN